jgi:hypothetical protein
MLTGTAQALNNGFSLMTVAQVMDWKKRVMQMIVLVYLTQRLSHFLPEHSQSHILCLIAISPMEVMGSHEEKKQ